MESARILVFIMTGMLLSLLGVLVVGLSLGWHQDELADTGILPNINNSFNELTLGQPPGTIIEDMEDIDGLIALSLSGGGLPPRIVLVDPRKGQVAGIVGVTHPLNSGQGPDKK